ncbi:MAG: YfhO family protein [Phaeodactylibacter sp.]|nr:YfhO family protein [Phaeodactylibacter sp.]
MNQLIQKAIPHLIAIAIFLVACAAYFSPQLQGKVPQQSDIIQYRGMAQEAKEFYERTGEQTLWTNSMFGGMPTYQINTVSAGNNLKVLDSISSLFINAPIGRFFAAMLGFYILMVVLGANQWLAVIGGIAFGLTTNTLILYEAGHLTKVKSISYLPLVAAGLMLAFRRRYLLGGILFAVGLGLNIMANHVQMTYYFFLTLIIFGIAQLVYSIQRKELAHFGKAAAALLVGGLLAIGSAASNLWITYEYAKDTMRGEPILETQGEPTSSSETEGLEWDYAMMWSNGAIDLFSSFIPGVAGGGSQEPVGPNSAVVKDLQSKGARLPANFSAPLYWGSLPFTSGPSYFGAVIFLFFLMGLFLVKGPVKWWIGLGALLTFMLSMGKNLEWFNRLFFEYFPLYNKFRTPNSILSVTAFLAPTLGLLALHKVVNDKVSKEEALRSLMIAGGIAGLASLFFAFLGPSFFDFTSPQDQRYAQAGYDVNAIIADRKALMRSDAFRSLILVLLSGGLLWAYLQEKVKLNILLIGLAVLTIFDLWTVGRRYVNNDIFVSSTQYQANFQPSPADQQILQDPDPNFRVYDATASTFQSSRASYFHKSIGGYHAAKLQRYQDIIDRHLSQNNQQVLDMLNTRYFIVNGQDGQPAVRRNPNALGNAWFVGNIRMVNTANEEIDALNDFDPSNDAVVHQEFSDYVSGLNPSKAGAISLTKYEPNHLTYQSDAPSEQFAVFSEIWYNKGWQAYIDGEPVEHIRVNYILRGLRVPAGQHTIEFKFEPKAFARGKLVSGIFSTIILLGLLGFIGYRGYQYVQNPPEEPKPEKKAASGKRGTGIRKKPKAGRRKKG